MKKKFFSKSMSWILAFVTILDAAFSASTVWKPASPDVSAADGYGNHVEHYGNYWYTVEEDDTVTINLVDKGETEITIPGTIDGKRVTTIGNCSFYNCTNLTSVIIPDSVTVIREAAFDSCRDLTSITIPDSVTTIGDKAFNECTSLTSITIPDSITSIGNDVFSHCESLTSITIPDSVTSIGENAFLACRGLTSITLPDSVTSIGKSAFSNCEGLTSFTIPAGVTEIGKSVFCDCCSMTSITIHNSVTKIGPYAFFYCGSLKSITIPDSVTSIGDSAFLGCSDLTSITIPDSVTFIDDEAFYQCKRLASITIPDSVTWIGHLAFNDTAWYENQPNGLVYAGKVLYKYIGEGPYGELEIRGDTVSICDAAFWGCRGMKSITIPDSVTSIGPQAFYGCINLRSITIPDNVTSIGTAAFKDTAWNNNLPDGIICLGKVLYRYKGTMPENTSITVPDGVMTIESGAFTGCTGLTSITIPDSVKTIKNGAFYGCTGLTSITIPDSVTSIGERAFEGCSGLVNVTIGSGVTSIGNKAFSGCTNLAGITVDNKNQTFLSDDNGVLFNKEKTILLCYPCGNPNPLYRIPDGIEKIADNAFYGFKYLDKIIVPDSVQFMIYKYNFGFINGQKFYSLTIYGGKNTSIERYADYYDFNYVTLDELSPVNRSSLSAKSTTLGSSINVSCAASGGMDPYQYAVFYKQKTQTKWTCAQSFKSNASVMITPKAATNYTVRVKVKDATGEIVNKDFTLKVTKPVIKPQNTSGISADTITLGKPVTVTCSGTGGRTPYSYAVYYKQTKQTNWTCVQSYGKNTSVKITPKAATAYTIRIKMKDSRGKIVNKDITLTVQKQASTALTNSSTISATRTTPGESVLVTCAGSGGKGPYQYAVFYKQTKQTNWTCAQGYGRNTTVTITPLAATTYNVRVKLKDSAGNIVNKDFKLISAAISPLRFSGS